MTSYACKKSDFTHVRILKQQKLFQSVAQNGTSLMAGGGGGGEGEGGRLVGVCGQIFATMLLHL